MADDSQLKMAEIAKGLLVAAILAVLFYLAACGTVGVSIQREQSTVAGDTWGVDVLRDETGAVSRVYIEGEGFPAEWDVQTGRTPDGWNYVRLERR